MQDDDHAKWFWEVLREDFTAAERTAFLAFVWAHTRMPASAAEFPMPFKLQRDTHDGAPDKYLPHAATCFFSLALPKYSSREVLAKRLRYAITSSPNMDADVRLHSAEGWAGM